MEITSMSPKLAQLLWPLLWALAYVRSEEASSDRGKAFLLCKAALWRKWSERGPEEVSALVKSTMQGREELSYEQTARMLAERQLAQCAREVTSADLEAHAAGRLSDAVVDRLVAIEGSEPTLSAEDRGWGSQRISKKEESLQLNWGGKSKDTKGTKVRLQQVTVVNDRHALAAHEYWHRRTGSSWIDPVWMDDASYSSSGILLALERLEAPGQPRSSQVRIRFRAADQEATVDFLVTDVSHSEFEVRVLDERRSRRHDQEVYLSSEEYANLDVRLCGTPAATGRIRTLDIVGGYWSADTRQCARHELSLQERQRKTLLLEELAERRRSEARGLRGAPGEEHHGEAQRRHQRSLSGFNRRR
ncbi:Uncharacterized protein SCF082_LOCUS7143 [Durusdinium trenchii]|uniref:Uncharacterized protein n=1 Tax=Durusdinium trenchii TaxID=1381693 RepID=A0ABP0IHC4_9DINO